MHHKAGTLCNHSHADCLQVLFCRIGQERIHILGIHHHSHALLGFRNCNLRSVQTGILLRHLVQINLQTGSQLADGYRHTAGAEIVALFDDAGYLRTAEHSLDLPLGRRISLLHLGAAHLNGSFRMHLGGTGSAADAVPAGASAQKNDHISRI